MSIIWSRTESTSGPQLTIVFPNGETQVLNKNHPSLKEVTLKLANGESEEALRAVLSPASAIVNRFQRLSTRITTDGVNILFDGDVIHDSLTDYILKLITLEQESKNGPSWKPFVNFLEKLSLNPNPESRRALYSFIETHGLTIRADGDFIAYKGVDSELNSIRSGYGVVNDVEKNGQLPNQPGYTLEYPRSKVNADSSVACAEGLHAGTRAYAEAYGRVVVVVAINPRDVVAVPSDHNAAKIRLCRYEVIERIERDSPKIATVGEKSTPIFEPAKESKVSRKLKKAIANDEEVTLIVLVNGEETAFHVKPVKLHAAHVVTVKDPQTHARITRAPRTVFKLADVKKVKRYSNEA